MVKLEKKHVFRCFVLWFWRTVAQNVIQEEVALHDQRQMRIYATNILGYKHDRYILKNKDFIKISSNIGYRYLYSNIYLFCNL